LEQEVTAEDIKIHGVQIQDRVGVVTANIVMKTVVQLVDKFQLRLIVVTTAIVVVQLQLVKL
jgi:hypothetical protein